MLFDGQRPENSVDAVASVRVEVVKHQQMHHDIVDKEMRDVDAGTKGRDYQEQGKGHQIRRIEPADATTPKRSKLDRLRLPVRARLGPLQVNTESRDDEEEEDADVAKRTDELQQLYRPAKKIIRNRIGGLHHRVIEHHSERRDAAQRVNAL